MFDPASMMVMSAINAGAQIFGANKAAGAQTDAANAGILAQQQAFNKLKSWLKPYQKAGTETLGTLQDRMPFLTSPITMDQETLEGTPGYEFLLSQGNKNIQANAAARGLGSSGTAMKAAQRFGVDLANTTYKDQFNMENINRQNEFARLMEMVNMGRGAAGALGGGAMQLGQGTSSLMTGAGNAQAGAYMAGANAIGNAGNSIMNYAMMNQYMNPNAGTGMYGNQQQPAYSAAPQSPWVSNAIGNYNNAGWGA